MLFVLLRDALSTMHHRYSAFAFADQKSLHWRQYGLHRHIDQMKLLGRWSMQNKIANRLRELEAAGVTNTEAKSPVILLSKVLANVFEAIVSRRTAAKLHSGNTWQQIKLVVNDQDFVRQDFVVGANCRNRLARAVHPGPGFEQMNQAAMEPAIGKISEELRFLVKACCRVELGKQPIQEPKTGVVAIRFVFRPGVTKPNHQPDRCLLIGGLNYFLPLALPAGLAAVSAGAISSATGRVTVTSTGFSLARKTGVTPSGK